MGTALENGSLKFVSVIHELLNGGETTDLVPLNNLVTSHFSATALLLLLLRPCFTAFEATARRGYRPKLLIMACQYRPRISSPARKCCRRRRSARTHTIRSGAARPSEATTRPSVRVNTSFKVGMIERNLRLIVNSQFALVSRSCGGAFTLLEMPGRGWALRSAGKVTRMMIIVMKI